MAPMLKIVLVLCILTACSQQAPLHSLVDPKGDAVHIALETINNGQVHFFTYKFDGRNVNFFVRPDGEGGLLTHFDACYSCFKYKLGYVREGNQMVCIACRIGYDLDDTIWDYVGACAPISLKSRLSGDHLVIRNARLEKGSTLF